MTLGPGARYTRSRDRVLYDVYQGGRIMSSEQHACPKCNSDMEVGYIPDRVYDQNMVFVHDWVKGKPDPSFWGGFKTKDKPSFSVITYRCKKCGFLESYAQNK